MKNDLTLEQIGQLAKNYVIAEIERVKARNARAAARSVNHCIVQEMPGIQDGYCYHSGTPVGDWCKGCQNVQPYHMAYRGAARNAQLARYKMTRAIKRMLDQEAARE